VNRALARHLEVHPEVRAALADGRPVLALESTIISHGMPYPQNVETARRVEQRVREGGAIPATIGVLGGRIRVGLTDEELERLGPARGVAKVSRRDLPLVLSTGRDGATTVAGTMVCAAMAGIRLMATGGIGGVHRGGECTMDLSPDLQELARTSVGVVCAGAKSILDLGRTLEVLETFGVPVLGYRTDELPAFYYRDSGLPVTLRVETPEAVAAVLQTKWSLGLEGGVLITTPVPDAHALDRDEVEGWISEGLALAEAAGIVGQAVTPFLLERVRELSGGRSLAANIALIEENATLGARIAVALARDLTETDSGIA